MKRKTKGLILFASVEACAIIVGFTIAQIVRSVSPGVTFFDLLLLMPPIIWAMNALGASALLGAGLFMLLDDSSVENEQLV